ncbi:MAG: AAA family ATPase [Chlamydiota bacterium]
MQKLPIGISGFTELRKKNCVYVDKTKHIYSLLKDNSRTFLSRPRRFGKSLFLSALEAALQGKKELFEGLWIAKSDYSFEPKGVINLDFSKLTVDSKDGFLRSLIYVLKEIGKINEVLLEENPDLNVVFMNLISALYTKFQFVAILIDEYDYPILHTLHKPDLAKEIRDVMKSFSCVVKAQKDFVEFVFVTGVSAFSKSGLSSGLNNLTNLTMNKEFFDVCGYTDKEVDLYFKEHVTAWAEEENIPYETLRENLKSWYNGYCFKENTPTIYSPFSLTCALNIKEIQNFWFQSATPQFLLDELSKQERQEECKFLNMEGLQGSMDLLQTFEIECIPLTALLFQTGYLTIADYDPESRLYQLRYPNLEVKTAMHRHLLIALTKIAYSPFDTLIGKLFTALRQENMEDLIECFTSIFSNIPYQIHQKAEKFYHAVLQALFVASNIKSHAEYSTSQGRADIILDLPSMYYILELKVNKPPEEALHQIETQKYYEPFLHQGKPIRAVGISFTRKNASKKEKSHFSITYATKKLRD